MAPGAVVDQRIVDLQEWEQYSCTVSIVDDSCLESARNMLK